MEITQADIEAVLKSFESKDINQVMSHFTDDAVLIDPHYPIIEMRGKEAIKKGLLWGLKPLISASFEIEKFWITGNEGAVKVETNHVFKGGRKISINQVFLFAMNDKKKIIYLQSFVPYRPHGLEGLMPRVFGLFWK
jgi:ketosteroid isomerase-like protein